MIRKMTLFIATGLMVSMIALTAAAQRGQQLEGKKANEAKIIEEKKPGNIAEKKGAKLPASLEILSVTKDNNAARKNPNGPGILVPVDIRWKLPQGAR
ncbi:MAG: hypothetical protein M3X11_13810, partial [Acidobacteriota bacterium]|nr:hypothetical protein [Acidobacteriota bacterium]